MDNRSFESGAAAGAPTAPASPSTGYPTNGNPSTGTPATLPGEYWFHQIGEELRSVLTACGITPDDAELNQLAKAVQGGKLITATAGGTADAITATFGLPVATLVGGMRLLVRAASANATATPTFSPDGLPAKTIVKGNNYALAAGDIIGAGYWIDVIYDAVLDKWVLANPATGTGATGYLLVKDIKAQGTDGGTSTAGINIRVLNTVEKNTIAGASLASNQITLPAGEYRIKATAPCSANSSQLYLYNVTDAANALIGTSTQGIQAGAADVAISESKIIGALTIASAKVFELRHYVSENNATDGLGVAVNQAAEVYSIIDIEKVG